MNYDQARGKLLKCVERLGKQTTACILDAGCYASHAIAAKLRQHPPATHRLERARTIADLKKDVDALTGNDRYELSRWIRCFGTAQAFGIDQARTLPVNTLRALAPLVKRNSRNETWTIKAKHRQFALDLWARATVTTAAEVKTLVQQHIRHGTTKATTTTAYKTLAAKIATWPDGEQRTLALEILERLDRKIPLPVTPTRPLSFFSRKTA